MKRIIAIIALLVSLCVFGVSVAETPNIPKFEGIFSVRNGISFGMSGADVEAIETGLGSKKENTSDKLQFKGSAAGYDETNIRYYFNKGFNDLFTFDYEIGRYADWTQSEGTQVYEELVNTMLAKYGDPFHSAKDGELFPILSSAYNFLGVVKDYYNLRDFNQWIVEYDDGYIITHSTMLAP